MQSIILGVRAGYSLQVLAALFTKFSFFLYLLLSFSHCALPNVCGLSAAIPNAKSYLTLAVAGPLAFFLFRSHSHTTLCITSAGFLLLSLTRIIVKEKVQ